MITIVSAQLANRITRREITKWFDLQCKKAHLITGLKANGVQLPCRHHKARRSAGFDEVYRSKFRFIHRHPNNLHTKNLMHPASIILSHFLYTTAIDTLCTFGFDVHLSFAYNQSLLI